MSRERRSRARAPFTLAAAVVLFLGGTAYGVKLVTAPAETATKGPTCEPRTIKSGENVTPNLIKINVINSGNRSGLANRVNINLQRKGFLDGTIGNSAGGITTKKVTIVTSDKAKPEVKLVARQFKDKVAYAKPKQALADGVTVVVGDDYAGLIKKAPRAVKSDRDVEFCLPIVTIG